MKIKDVLHYFLYQCKHASIYLMRIVFAYIKYYLGYLFKKNDFKYSQGAQELAVHIICKDDEDCLKESIEYHTLIGVDHFLIYDNNSKRPLKETLKHYTNVTVIDWPYHLRQRVSQTDCTNRFRSKFKWIAILDTDEFIVMKDGNTNLKEFLKPYRKYGGLAVGFVNFGSSGYLKKQKRVITSYTQIESYDYVGKSIFINTKYYLHQGLGCHDHHSIPGNFFVNEQFNRKISFDFLCDALKIQFWFPRLFKYLINISKNPTDKIQINHYFKRSLEDFRQRSLRVQDQKDLPAYSPNKRFANMDVNKKVWSENSGGEKDIAILELIEKVKQSKLKSTVEKSVVRET